MAEMVLALFNKLGVIIILAFILSKIEGFRKLIIKKKMTFIDKVILSMLFGCIGIMGTYSNIPIHGSFANLTTIGVVVGAILGGPVVGLFAGSIAAMHRYLIDMNGFTAVASSISIIIGAVAAAYVYYFIKNKLSHWKTVFITVVITEIAQTLLLLALSRPSFEGLELAKVTLLPMMFVNALGITIFIGIIENIYSEYDCIAAGQAQKALKIANLTLPYFRQGLNYDVAQKVVDIIYDAVDVEAVTITNCKEILAHKGIGEDHHIAGHSFQTQTTREVIETGKYKVINTKESIRCNQHYCQLKSGIVVPLKERDRIVGTLKLYKTEENSITSMDIELGLGLAQLFSTQIELSKLDHQKKLITEAELKSLQAQINPHFLFNAINTIVSFIQFDTIKARHLLISLANLFRKSLSHHQDMVDIEVELEHVASYLEIEKARFGDKLQVKYDLQTNIFCKLPPLILQPIVENAILHGILPKKQGGCITIKSKKDKKDILLEVIDDGVGIKPDKLMILLKEESYTRSVGLSNVNKRLINLYGEDHKLQITSRFNEGTCVLIRIPYIEEQHTSEMEGVVA
ncbi:histidine kinase [Clostridium formicaceticum]|uniref:histidine kinase n=1 Tax=Clostridium formicaceticum TaxID=1497 RepID=A0ABN4TFY2_9CLOT|nr:histidine kinase [Clostridium formicaceticum]